MPIPEPTMRQLLLTEGTEKSEDGLLAGSHKFKVTFQRMVEVNLDSPMSAEQVFDELKRQLGGIRITQIDVVNP